MASNMRNKGYGLLRTPTPDQADILTPEALAFLTELQRRFGPRRLALLANRRGMQKRLDAGLRPDFRPETSWIRDSHWTVAPIPKDLRDRRVEITGPVERKMIINALNSGANVFMADFEDSTSPTWTNIVTGQINLRDAVTGTITYVDAKNGKQYALEDKRATLIVRPRGWHLLEQHMLVDGEPVSASLFDFAIFFFHNARPLLDQGSGPYFYLPKLENHVEARLWNDVFNHAQDLLGIPRGTIRATVLIETILAAFEMDEILYELRTHAAGLNCGRWDYIFSFIKKFRLRSACTLPDRDQVGMTRHFLRSYSRLLIQTCHRRHAHAMGGMAAQIPIKGDASANEAALAKVRADKEREVLDGHDGTWVAHPGLVPLARQVFDTHMPAANQIDCARAEIQVRAGDLLAVPDGTVTAAGLRHNINVGILYLEAWLRGTGCVPLYNLMEDAATAEICRAQVWQWLRHGTRLDDGRVVDRELVHRCVQEELHSIRDDSAGIGSGVDEAANIFTSLICNEEFEEFLTLPAYQRLSAANVAQD